MTKAEIVAKISDKLGVDKADVQAIVVLVALLSKLVLKKPVVTFLKIRLLLSQLTTFLLSNLQKYLFKELKTM